MARIAPFGSWASPISADLAATASTSFVDLALDGRDVYWLETRPDEGGRSVVMRLQPSGTVSELTPPGFNVRSTVHEYGGGAFAVLRGTIFFANYGDQRVYMQAARAAPTPLSPSGRFRHADLVVDPWRDRILCVREDHSGPGEALNSMVAINMDGRQSTTLVSGNDFYASPSISPDGTQFAYLTWNHPNMPWDGCELRLARFGGDGCLGPSQRIAGGESESIFQPAWSPQGVLHFVSDRTGWWNLYQWRSGSAQPLLPMPADFGRAMWNFGQSTYSFASETRLLCCYTERGVDHIAWLDTANARLTPILASFTKVDSVRCRNGLAIFIASSPTSPPAIIQLDLETGRPAPLRAAFELQLDAGLISVPQPIDWPAEDGQTAHGLYYEPSNPPWQGVRAAAPPLLLRCHSGPTSAADPTLSIPVQYWTSRGFAVLEVNYGGSTGYGRAYRDRLNGQWGVVDVGDCCSGALYLTHQGLVDRARLVVRGSSAGGFTALACLTSRNDIFSAGSASYAIADLEILARASHKFESHHHERLIAPYPQRRDLYWSRSPIRHVESLRAAVILFHGGDDKVVSPEQSRLMHAAIRTAGQPTAFVLFPGEGHGFRNASTIRRALEAELYFLSKIYGFLPAETLGALDIENLPPQAGNPGQ